MAILHWGREAEAFKTGLGVACIEKDDITFASWAIDKFNLITRPHRMNARFHQPRPHVLNRCKVIDALSTICLEHACRMLEVHQTHSSDHRIRIQTGVKECLLSENNGTIVSLILFNSNNKNYCTNIWLTKMKERGRLKILGNPHRMRLVFTSVGNPVFSGLLRGVIQPRPRTATVTSAPFSLATW